MSKYVKEKKKTKEMLYYEILTDPEFLPETKLVLVYMLETKHGYLKEIVELDDDVVMEELHLSAYKYNRAKRQLKKAELVKE
jgi:hypothetical protein